MRYTLHAHRHDDGTEALEVLLQNELRRPLDWLLQLDRLVLQTRQRRGASGRCY
jgi:hypothetical protein